MPFLDVLVDATNTNYETQVYRKETNTGHCLNGKSECPQRYKDSVIRAYVHRALTHCSSWELVHQELTRIRSVLASNSYEKENIEDIISRQLNKHCQQKPAAKPKGSEIKIFYQNTMTSEYKKEEKSLQDIVMKNCKPKNPDHKINLVIFYKNPRISSLVMKNNLSEKYSKLKATNIVYKFKCPFGDCAHRPERSYVGYTTTSFSRRMTMHLQEGAPEKHVRRDHDKTLTRAILVENTDILAQCEDKKKLQVLESVFIRDLSPTINRQMNQISTLSLFDGAPLGPRLR